MPDDPIPFPPQQPSAASSSKKNLPAGNGAPVGKKAPLSPSLPESLKPRIGVAPAPSAPIRREPSMILQRIGIGVASVAGTLFLLWVLARLGTVFAAALFQPIVHHLPEKLYRVKATPHPIPASELPPGPPAPEHLPQTLPPMPSREQVQPAPAQEQTQPVPAQEQSAPKPTATPRRVKVS